jgi:hypothetical protein
MFSEWCSVQKASFGDLRTRVSNHLKKCAKTDSDTGAFGIRFNYYADAEQRPRAQRAFDIGQAIGDCTKKSNGFASGPIGLLAAGHLSAAMAALGELAMTNLSERPSAPGESYNRVLLALRFAECSFDELTSEDERRRHRDALSGVTLRPSQRVGARIRQIYTDFHFRRPDCEKRYSWALETFENVGCKSKSPHSRHKGHPLYKYFAAATECASGIWHHADSAMAMMWDALRIPWRYYTWATLSGAYHNHSAFRKYIDDRYQNQIEAYVRIVSGRQQSELDSGLGPGKVRS